MMEMSLLNEMERRRLCWSGLIVVLVAVNACGILLVAAFMFLMYILTFVLSSFACLCVPFVVAAAETVEIDLGLGRFAPE